MLNAQVAGSHDGADFRVPGLFVGQQNVGRQAGIVGATEMAHDRPGRGMCWRRDVARVPGRQPVSGDVMSVGGVSDRTDQGGLVDDLCRPRQFLAKRDAGVPGRDHPVGAPVFDGSLGLGVKSFELAVASAQPELDDSGVAVDLVRRIGRRSTQSQQFGQCQSSSAGRECAVEELSSCVWHERCVSVPGTVE